VSRLKGAGNKIVKPETLERREALQATAGRRHRTIALANTYLEQTGISQADFAHRIGCGYSTLRKFLADRYEHVASSDSLITQKVLDYIERYPARPAEEFGGKLYDIGNVHCLRDLLARALDRPHIFMLYAPPGSGKTSVVKGLIAEHNAASANDERRAHIFHIYCRAGIRPHSLVRRIAQACGTSVAGDIDRVLGNIVWEFRRQRVVLIFDEAQHLDVVSMETVRELFDQAGFSLIFTGSHELETVFRRFAGTLEQLERRVTDKITLPAVTREEAAHIIRSELQDLVPEIDSSLIQQQIERATVEIRVKKGSPAQRYISIGRLMAALHEVRELLASSVSEPTASAEQEVA
jgi:DNA transposition AAA+ family ATPase